MTELNSGAIIAPDAGVQARHKAKYGGKTWIAYTHKQHGRVAELLTTESVKRAMLNMGTAGHFTDYTRDGGCMNFWNMGCNILRQLKAKHHYSDLSPKRKFGHLST